MDYFWAIFNFANVLFNCYTLMSMGRTMKMMLVTRINVRFDIDSMRMIEEMGVVEHEKMDSTIEDLTKIEAEITQEIRSASRREFVVIFIIVACSALCARNIHNILKAKELL